MKRFLLIGFIVVLLAAIPLTMYILVTQRTVTKSGAAPTSRLAFVAPTDPVVVGTPVTIPLTVDPTSNGGSNVVSFVKVAFTYDGNKLQVGSNYFTNGQSFPTTLEGPTNNCDTNKLCTITVTVSIGANPQQGVTSLTNVGTITFTPLAATDTNNPTVLNFVANQIQILSLATADQPAENVFAGGTSLPLTIVTAGSLSGTPVPTDTPEPTTTTTTDNTTGGTSDTGGSSTTTSGGGTTSGNTPTCSSLTADQNNTSNGAPFTVLLTAVGTSDTSTISKVSFNFGDGNSQDVTTGGGIGTASVSTQISHVYQANGTFTATASLTDADGNISAAGSCTQTIAIGGTQTAQANTPTPTGTPQPVTTVGATGPGQTFLLAGAGGAVLVTIGLVLLLAL